MWAPCAKLITIGSVGLDLSMTPALKQWVRALLGGLHPLNRLGVSSPTDKEIAESLSVILGPGRIWRLKKSNL